MQFNLISVVTDPGHLAVEIILPSSYKATRSKSELGKVKKIWSLEKDFQSDQIASCLP